MYIKSHKSKHDISSVQLPACNGELTLKANAPIQ